MYSPATASSKMIYDERAVLHWDNTSTGRYTGDWDICISTGTKRSLLEPLGDVADNSVGKRVSIARYGDSGRGPWSRYYGTLTSSQVVC